MDNILEYIVFIIFLISILNGIFGKKKKQQQKAESERASQSKPQTAKSVPQKKTQDILEELFGLKMTPEEQIDSKKVVAKKFQHEDTWDPEDEFKEVDYYSKDETKNKYTPQPYQPNEQYPKPEERIRASKKYPSLDKITETSKNKRRDEIKKKLNNPQTIRDYIIVQELLNEPKAFRI